MQINQVVFQRALVELLLLIFAGLLIYGDYLQEVSIFSVSVDLPEFKAGLDLFKAFKKCYTMNQHSQAIANKDEVFILPPFPQLDLSYIGPVFFENGTLVLSCKAEFTNVRCKTKGKIRADRVYMSTTHFDYAADQIMRFQFEGRDFIQTRRNKNTRIQQNYRPAILLTNYMFFLGYNGSNLPLLGDDFSHISEQSLEYQELFQQTANFVDILSLKWVNFVLLAVGIGYLYCSHLPVLFIGGGGRSTYTIQPKTLPISRPSSSPSSSPRSSPSSNPSSSSLSILESIPALFGEDNPDSEESPLPEYSRYCYLDELRNRYQLGHLLLTAAFCTHFLLAYLVSVLLMNSSSRTLSAMGVDGQLTQWQDPTAANAETTGGNTATTRRDAFASFLNFFRMLLNLILSTFFHWTFAFLMYIYSKDLN